MSEHVKAFGLLMLIVIAVAVCTTASILYTQAFILILGVVVLAVFLFVTYLICLDIVRKR